MSPISYTTIWHENVHARQLNKCEAGKERVTAALPYLGISNVDADGIVHLDVGVREANSAGIVGNQHGHCLRTDKHLADPTELVGSFLRGDSTRNKAPLCVEQQTEVLLCLFKGDDIHESSRVALIRAHLAIDLDQALHHNELRLMVGERILQAVAEEDRQRQALTQLVWT